VLLLGIDGGGTVTRGRLTDMAGQVLGPWHRGSGQFAPRNRGRASARCSPSRSNVSRRPISRATRLKRIVACLALAGASEPTELAAARKHVHPYRKVVITTDAHAACLGAHHGKDGGVVNRRHRRDRLRQHCRRRIPLRRLGLPGLRRSSGACSAARRCAAFYGRMTDASAGADACARCLPNSNRTPIGSCIG